MPSPADRRIARQSILFAPLPDGLAETLLARAFARLRDSGVHVKHNHAAIADVARLREYAGEDRSAAWSRAE